MSSVIPLHKTEHDMELAVIAGYEACKRGEERDVAKDTTKPRLFYPEQKETYRHNKKVERAWFKGYDKRLKEVYNEG